MKTKTKKKLIIWAVVIVLLAVMEFCAYKFSLRFIGRKAVDVILTNQINTMLDSGEVTLEELEEIIADDETEETFTGDEKSGEEAPSQQAEEQSQNTEEKEQKKIETKKPIQEQTRKDIVDRTKFKVTKDISDEDTEAVAKLIASRLSAADIKYLSGLLAGGVTAEEISAAARLAYSRFTSEEITQVKMYWHRYKNKIKRAP